MVVFGLLKDLASRELVVNGCMSSYSWENVFYVVFSVPIISSLDPTRII